MPSLIVEGTFLIIVVFVLFGFLGHRQFGRVLPATQSILGYWPLVQGLTHRCIPILCTLSNMLISHDHQSQSPSFSLQMVAENFMLDSFILALVSLYVLVGLEMEACLHGAHNLLTN